MASNTTNAPRAANARRETSPPAATRDTIRILAWLKNNAPQAGVLAEIVQADGATVTAEQVIAKIDTEGKASAAPAAAAALAPAEAAAAPTAGSKSGIAMPAAKPDGAMAAAGAAACKWSPGWGAC